MGVVENYFCYVCSYVHIRIHAYMHEYRATLSFPRVVSMLIEICRKAILKKDNNGDLPLHLACQRGHTKVAKELLDLECDTLERKYRYMHPTM